MTDYDNSKYLQNYNLTYATAYQGVSGSVPKTIIEYFLLKKCLKNRLFVYQPLVERAKLRYYWFDLKKTLLDSPIIEEWYI